MHKDTLPTKVDPFRLADLSLGLRGTLPISKMTRLCPSLASSEGEVAVDLVFGVDEEDIRYVRGQMTTCLMLNCQRCLVPFRYEIIGNFMLGIVRTEEEADRLPKRYDPLCVPDLSLVISEVVEDELIVSLPIVPMHAVSECKAKQSIESHSIETDNPFGVIESLRSKRDDI